MRGRLVMAVVVGLMTSGIVEAQEPGFEGLARTDAVAPDRGVGPALDAAALDARLVEAEEATNRALAAFERLVVAAEHEVVVRQESSASEEGGQEETPETKGRSPAGESPVRLTPSQQAGSESCVEAWPTGSCEA